MDAMMRNVEMHRSFWPHWGAILAAAVAGLGTTLLLVTLGWALDVGVDQAALDNGSSITVIDSWHVVWGLIGIGVGAFVGGCFARNASPMSVLFHGFLAWASLLVLGTFVGGVGAVSLFDIGSLASASAQIGSLDLIAWGGWALFVGCIVSLALAVALWAVGALATSMMRDEAIMAREFRAVTTNGAAAPQVGAYQGIERRRFQRRELDRPRTMV